MNIHITVIAYGLADDLLTLVAQANGAGITWHLFLHSQFPAVVAACYDLAQRERVVLYDYGDNRGVARSWNEGLIASYAGGADIAMIANDDVIASYGDVCAIAESALEERDRETGSPFYMVSGQGYDARQRQYGDMLMAMAAITRFGFEQLGCFDENFWPLYYEDRDYYARADRAGLARLHLADTNIWHAGSKTLYSVPGQMGWHHEQFLRNQAYYVRKWGGTPEQECFSRPFNDPALTLRINPADRNTPYPNYDRKDRHALQHGT
jgi:GT2 family glycosyltransferase